MPSRLDGLQRTLTWQDFGPPRAGNPPPPGQRGTAAQTRARPTRSIFAEPVPGPRPPQFRLRDDAIISVDLDRGQTFVNQWTLNMPAPFPTDVLHHEQGHYDLVALFCRDMFIELMALKQQFCPRPQQSSRPHRGSFSDLMALSRQYMRHTTIKLITALSRSNNSAGTVLSAAPLRPHELPR